MWKKNTLIDNSSGRTMADCIRYLIGQEDCREVCIATGYWDIPGLSLIRSELAAFFTRGGKIRMIIGQEPVIREYQLAAVKEPS